MIQSVNFTNAVKSAAISWKNYVSFNCKYWVLIKSSNTGHNILEFAIFWYRY